SAFRPRNRAQKSSAASSGSSAGGTNKKAITRSMPMSAQRESKRVVIVGGGLAGLASAVDLRGRGAHVIIVESNEHLGGKMNVLAEQGFTFDMGPTILTLPEVLCGIIRRAGRRVPDLIDLVRLDPQ